MTHSPEALETSNGRSHAVAALLEAAQALLENRAFGDVSRAVLSTCRTILGAGAGLVVVCAAAGNRFEAVHLDAEGLHLDDAGRLPAALRRLGARARKGRTVFANDLAKADRRRSPTPKGLSLSSALFAPINLAGEVAGLLGLVNKPGGFVDADAQLAEVFAEMAAVAMLRSRTVHGFESRRTALESQVLDATTQLRAAYESERVARQLADRLREATVALTRSLDRETVLATLLDRLRGMVAFDRASVLWLEEASRVSVRALFDGELVVVSRREEREEFDPADHPVVQSVLETATPMVIADVRALPDRSLPTDRSQGSSWMGIPLFARGEVAGLLSLSNREAGFFTEGHVRVAEAMASQASVAVENAVLFEQMQESTARMQLLSRRLLEAQESERRNISRELHDEAGQALASLRFGLRLLERAILEGGNVTGQVAELMHRTDAVIDGLHRLAVDLRPASLDHLGLEAALRQLTRTTGSRLGLAIRFKALALPQERLPAAVETALYRIVQEALTNVERHAHATRVDVLIQRRGDRVIVTVEDDGVGFRPEPGQRGGQLGLLGLRERAEALNGTLTLESAPGSGTTVVVEVSSADPHPDR